MTALRPRMHSIVTALALVACVTQMVAAQWRAFPAAGAPARPTSRPEASGQAAAPIDFAPVTYWTSFSSTAPPALHILPGQTVRTTTLDNVGRDANNVFRAKLFNPETGPFFVDGAAAGDTLAVTLLRIRPNRDSAASGAAITDHALTWDYLGHMTHAADAASGWTLDRPGGLAMLASPSDHLKDLRVRLTPMLGCLAVAPPGDQRIRTDALGAWGGNLDYSGVREGATVYLPVFHPGALLFMGDGHAAQGDGELNNAGLETSMDVEFVVDVLRYPSSAPRVEDHESLMALGIDQDMHNAVRRATSGLAQWLERDYGLTSTDVALLLGSSMRYDVAEIVNPQINIVARISKELLPGRHPDATQERRNQGEQRQR